MNSTRAPFQKILKKIPAQRWRDAFEELIAGPNLPFRRSAPTPLQRQESTDADAAAGPCPEPGEWALLARGEPRPAELAKVNALLAHAAACRDCAQNVCRP